MERKDTDRLQAERFEQVVARHFAFLEDAYGLHRSPLKKLGEDAPLDYGFSVRYTGGTVDVHVGWGIADCVLNVVLRPHTESELPSRKPLRMKPVPLDRLVEHLTRGGEKPLLPLPNVATASFAEIKRARGKRARLVADSLEDVIAGLAGRLRAHGAKVLRGDLSELREIEGMEDSKGKE